MIRIIHSRRMDVFWRCWLPILPVVAAISSVSGCAEKTRLMTASLQHEIPAENAFIMPPPGGPGIVSVLQKNFTNGVEQTIFLATNSKVRGQNRFRVQITGNQDNSAGTTTPLSTKRLALSNPSGEARTAIPGVTLRRSAYFVKNRYGPFGYMIGRAGADLCLYAWQQIRARPALVGKRGLIDVRLRLCRSDSTEPQLLSAMFGYTINGYVPQAIWNPYGEAKSPPEDLATAGTEVYPLGEGGFQSVLPTGKGRPPWPRARAAEVSNTNVQKVVPRGPTVPPPPDSDSGSAVPPPPGPSR